MNQETTAELTAGISSTYVYRVLTSDFKRKDILEPYEEGVMEKKGGMLWFASFDAVNLAIAHIFYNVANMNSEIENISEHWRWNWMPSEKDMEFCFERKIQDGNTLTTKVIKYKIKQQEQSEKLLDCLK